MSNRSNGFSFPHPRLIRDFPARLPVVPMILALLGAWFGFANPMLHVPAAIVLLPMALIMAAANAQTGREAARLGFLTALPAYSAALYWLAIPVHDHGGLPWILALPCPVLVGAVLAAYASVFCVLSHRAKKADHVLGSVFAAASWTGLELARNTLLTGFPWLTLSSALSPWPWAIGLSAWIGAFGLSGILVGICHALVMGRGLWKLAAIPLAVVCLLPAMVRQSAPPSNTASAVLIQGNIDQGQKWEPKLQSSILKTYLDLSHEAVAAHHPDIVVWPETAMPLYYQDGGPLAESVRATVDALNTPFMMGSPAYSSPQGKNQPKFVLHNRAYLLDEKGQTLSWYDKEHLVPFGEYVPLGQWLPFVTKLVQGDYEFRPGANYAPLRTGKLSLGTLICYEAIFPELAQKRVEQGANVLVNISNDAWFGHSSAPRQHLHLAILRAVEQNRSILRATNTGVTTFIAPTGRLHEQSEPFAPNFLRKGDIPLLTGTTFYHDHFQLVHWSFLALIAGLFPVVGHSRKYHPHK